MVAQQRSMLSNSLIIRQGGKNKKVMEFVDDIQLCSKVKSPEKNRKTFHHTVHK